MYPHYIVWNGCDPSRERDVGPTQGSPPSLRQGTGRNSV
jgi:hypothetical protein